MNCLKLVRRLPVLSLLVFFTAAARAELPEWIWNANNGAKAADNEVRYFRKTFKITGNFNKAQLSCAGDDEIQVFINGEKIGESTDWRTPLRKDVTKHLDGGENVIAVRGKNLTDVAGIIVMLEISTARNQKQYVLTDGSWTSTDKEIADWTKLEFKEVGWTKVASLGKLGVKPWGDVLHVPKATAADQLTVLPGFKAELIHNSEPGEGSWICLTVDDKGRLIISPQEGKGNLLRITLSSKGQVEKVEKIDQSVGQAMGLLYAYNGLYVNGAGPNGLGLYRLPEDRSRDRYGAPKLLRNIEGAAGEHGSHAVVLGPDKHIYVINGNFTKLPKDLLPTSPHKHYAEDQLLPRAKDGNGFGNDIQPPGGFLLRMELDGKNCELYSAGMRNTYDFAFNPDGEMIGFDSDMEWDWGMPWYRPIRIFHLVSGGDYGFREGSGKWPKYYPDSLPSTVDVGVGSPTGMKFGTKSNYPDKYKNALYALDWSYGRIFAVHLSPNGATYSATFEPFLKGKPLNLTDVEFGKDGAMYFITGGRGTQSGLYRVSYVGSGAKEEISAADKQMAKDGAKARELRHKLEQFHGKQNPKAVEFAWPHLDSPDRFIRYAARIAIESQPVAEWQDRALSETRPNAALISLLALARLGGKETQSPLLLRLAKFPLDGLTEEQKLEKLRVIELSFIRQGRPDADIAKMGIEKLDRQYPAKSEWLNRELSELLIYLQAPDVVKKTLALLDAVPTLEEQIHYIVHLRKLTAGWTLEDREHYFSWFNRNRAADLGGPTHHPGVTSYTWSGSKSDKSLHTAELIKWFTDADREYGDGSSYPKFISGFKKDAIDTLNASEKTELADFITDKKPEDKPAVVEHKFVKDWKMDDLQPSLDEVAKGRSFASGKATFAAAQCLACHRFGSEGGSVGPELTAVSSRFTRRDILESILEPSKVLSEQYQNIIFTKKDGDDVIGRIAEETDQKVVVITNPLTQARVEVMKSDIEKRVASKISPMPEGLVNMFTKSEILDLIAYMESGGKESAPAFEKKTSDAGNQPKNQ